jgi:hypothetical protein
MPKRTQWLKARPGKDRSQEIFEICLGQRRADSRGRRLRTFSMDELAGMSAAELAAVKRDGWTVLPDLITPHGPTGHDAEGIIECQCADCASAREAWQELTGKD